MSEVPLWRCSTLSTRNPNSVSYPALFQVSQGGAGLKNDIIILELRRRSTASGFRDRCCLDVFGGSTGGALSSLGINIFGTRVTDA